jgi:hypothetical protein
MLMCAPQILVKSMLRKRSFGNPFEPHARREERSMSAPGNLVTYVPVVMASGLIPGVGGPIRHVFPTFNIVGISPEPRDTARSESRAPFVPLS